jgi:hypothetical protein
MPRAQRTKSAVHEALQRRVGERPGDSFSGLLDAATPSHPRPTRCCASGMRLTTNHVASTPSTRTGSAGWRIGRDEADEYSPRNGWTDPAPIVPPQARTNPFELTLERSVSSKPAKSSRGANGSARV